MSKGSYEVILWFAEASVHPRWLPQFTQQGHRPLLPLLLFSTRMTPSLTRDSSRRTPKSALIAWFDRKYKVRDARGGELRLAVMTKTKPKG